MSAVEPDILNPSDPDTPALGISATDGAPSDDVAATMHRNVVTRAALFLIRLYQTYSSTRPPRCRYQPSCSNYTREAIELHGLWRGVWMGTRRIGRCAPWGDMGYDPVPHHYVAWGREHVHDEEETPTCR